MVHQDEHDVSVDPALLRLPDRSVWADGHPTAHIAHALRESGLEGEIDVVLPGGAGAVGAHFGGEHHDTVYTGGFRRGDLFENIDALRWPDSLYIPQGADSADYWLSPAPADRRYGLAWPPVGGSTPDWASREKGELFAYASLHPLEPGRGARSEAGVGVFHRPGFTLGTVRFEPVVTVRDGMLASVLDYFPTVSAGSVWLTASVLLASWQVIPGGFDLLAFREFRIARIVRDQSFGPERHRLPGPLYTPRSFSTDFLVQGGREYLFGAIGRVSISSTLTDPNGRPLRVPNPGDFTVYAWMTLAFPYMTVERRTVYQP